MKQVSKRRINETKILTLKLMKKKKSLPTKKWIIIIIAIEMKHKNYVKKQKH